MGLFRSGLFACLVAGLTAFGQQGTPTAPGAPAIVPDTNAPAPVIPQPEATPGVDPNALQPAPITPDLSTPAPTTNKVKAKKPAAPAMPTLRGTVTAIDKNAMTVTIHGKSKDETLNVTSKTRIFADSKPAILADAKEGEKVVAEYHTTKEKAKEALTLRFGGAGTPEHKTEKAEVKSAAKKPAKAAKATTRKKKKTKANDNAVPAPGTDTSITPLPGDTGAPVPAPGGAIPVPNPGTPLPGTPGANP